MSLVIDLKPGEKILIGEAVITNDSQRTRLKIDGDAPILREKDVLKKEEITSPCKRAYFMLQCMYLARRPSLLHEEYFALVTTIQKAAPSTTIFFVQIHDEIMNEHYYKALKLARQLIEHEQEMMDDALKQDAS